MKNLFAMYFMVGFQVVGTLAHARETSPKVAGRARQLDVRRAAQTVERPAQLSSNEVDLLSVRMPSSGQHEHLRSDELMEKQIEFMNRHYGNGPDRETMIIPPVSFPSCAFHGCQ